MSTPLTLTDLLSMPPRQASWSRCCGTLRLSAYLWPDGYHVAILDVSSDRRNGLAVVDGIHGDTLDEAAAQALSLGGPVSWLSPGLTTDILQDRIARGVELDDEGRVVIREQPQTAPPPSKDAPSVAPVVTPAPESSPRPKRQRKPKEVK